VLPAGTLTVSREVLAAQLPPSGARSLLLATSTPPLDGQSLKTRRTVSKAEVHVSSVTFWPSPGSAYQRSGEGAP
jgi:hypothetical protein